MNAWPFDDESVAAGMPLSGVRVVEFNAKGPVPHCTMLLASMGAQVVQIMRPGEPPRAARRFRFTDHGKKEVAADLKSAQDRALVLDLLEQADVLVEGFRPGVMERLGLGPEDCAQRNPRLIYARITGWGQHGERAQIAGHDINYLAAVGALDAIGTNDSGPVPPLNLLADFAGGSLHAAMGICAALHERHRTGLGRVIDAAMVDGVASLMTSLYAIRARGDWKGGRGNNFLDGGAPYYAVYQTQDGKYLAVGAMEPSFRQTLFRVLGLPADLASASEKCENWPAIKARVADAIKARSRDEWVRCFDGVDACVTPVASLEEALADPILRRRGVFIEQDGLVMPGAAPRFF